jgi:hypothetical protein
MDLVTDFRQILVIPQPSGQSPGEEQLLLNQADLDIKANQHAFMKGRSTVSASTSMNQYSYDLTDQGSPYKVVYMRCL